MTDLKFPHVVLSADEAISLVSLAQQRQSPSSGYARERLFLGHLRMVQMHAQRVADLTQASRDDLFQEGCLALGEAINKFDASHGNRFSTYAFVAIARRVAYNARMRPRDRESPLPDDYHLADEAASRAFDEVDFSLVSILELLPERSRTILVLRYGLDGRPRTLSECADQLGCSASTAARWEKEALAAARRSLERLSKGSAAEAAYVPSPAR